MKMDSHEKCYICLGSFKEPRILPCHHYFCIKCLQNCINAAPENSFRCPYCRAATAPEDMCLPLHKLAKGFPIVKTETKEENPCPFYCANCIKTDFYVDAFTVCLKRRVRLCYGCHGNNVDNDVDQQGEHQVPEDRVVHGQQNLPGNPVTAGLFFCFNCDTFSYAQHYASKHAVCIANNADAVQPFLDAVKKMREKKADVIKNMDDLLGETHNTLHDLSNLGQSWQHVDPERRVLFSIDENILKNYSKHLTTLDDTMCAIQLIPKSMCDHLESEKSLQRITDDLQYLKIQSLIGHDNEEFLRNYKNKLAKIAETTKNLKLSFQKLEETLFTMLA